MPQTRISCPRCRQPVMAEINQLFDVNTDPEAKQKLLSGQYNLINCPNCGYQGNYSTPLVYHDPSKELLLTFFPPDLGLPLKDQERIIGPLITRVTSSLPMEKRKAYLLRPQTMLTMQGLVERVLEADGITREMIQAQQKRLNLLQRLLTASSDEVRVQMIQQEKDLIDESFLALLNRMVEASMASNDETSARALVAIQQQLMENTEAGKAMQEQAVEAQAAIKSLQEASQKGLSREKLLDLMIEAPNETRLVTLVNLARNGMDYTFFQILSKRIEAAQGEKQQKLTDLRAHLLELTSEIDEEVKAQTEEARQVLEKLLASPDIQKATTEALPAISELFVQVLRDELQAARQKNDEDRLRKLQQVVVVLQRASAPPPEVALIQELMDTPDETTLNKVLQEHKKEITEEFMQTLGGLISQAQSGEQEQEPGVVEKLTEVYRAALRLSMQANFQA